MTKPIALTIAAVLLALLFLSPAAAIIKASQLGDTDWLQQFVGKISQVHFAANGRPRAYVATESNVVACLNLRNGDIVWRQVLHATTDPIEVLIVADQPEPAVITLSGGGQNLRAWHPSDGSLLWEHTLDGHNASHAVDGAAVRVAQPLSHASADDQLSRAVLVDVDSGGGLPLLVVFSSSRLQGFRLSRPGTAVLEWNVELRGWSHVTAVEVAADSTGVYAAALHSGGSKLEVAHVIAQGVSSSLERASSLSMPQPLKLPLLLWANGSGSATVTGLTSSTDQLCTYAIPGDETLHCQPVPAAIALTSADDSLRLLPVATPTHTVMLKGGSGVALLHRNSSGGLTAGATFPGATAVSRPVRVDGGAMVAVGGQRGSTLWAAVLNASDALQVITEEAVENVGMTDADGIAIPLESLHLGTYRRKDGTSGFRFVASLVDGTAVLLQQGTSVWTRHEGLATVTHARFADLPATATSSISGSMAASPTVRERLRVQLLSLKESVHLAGPVELKELREFREAHSSKHLPWSDANGFRRMLLVLTSSGSLAALHCGSGRILWSVHFGSATGRAIAASSQLLPWRSSHNLERSPQVLVLLPKNGGTLAAAVNIHSGKVVMQHSLSSSVQQVVRVPQPVHDGDVEQIVYLLISPPTPASSSSCGNSAGEAPSGEQLPPSVVVLPGGAASASAAEEAASTLHFWQASLTRGVLTGWGFQPGASLVPQLRWSSVRSPESPSLLAAVGRDSHEPLRSSAKVLGDRSLKVKHLNRHMLLLASGSTPGQPSSTPPQLAIELVDAVTGRSLFRQTHLGCHGPVQGVVAEHWVMYSFWNAIERRHQVALVELYEEVEVNRMQLLFGTSNRSASSYQAPQLKALHSSWFWGAEVTTAAVTTTALGIAPKSLLLGTSTDQVYLMDKRFLDPRRPHKTVKEMSAEEQGEMLLPYAPLLPLLPSSYATLTHRVAALRGVVSAAAVMESATHMVAYGIDLMYVRLSPAASFDGLDDSFPFALLVVLVATMTLGSVILRLFAVHRDVKVKWE